MGEPENYFKTCLYIHGTSLKVINFLRKAEISEFKNVIDY